MRRFIACIRVTVADDDERTPEDVAGMVWRALNRLEDDELGSATLSLPYVDHLASR